jgi:hypothetical protein
MTYHYGSPNQYPTHSSAANDASRWQSTDPNQRKLQGNHLVWVVLALGLAAYLVSYGPMPHPGGTGWDVRFSTLAAVVAALGLLPRQSAHMKLMVALAVMGFLEALPRWISATGGQSPSWAMIVIVVLNALQALAAIAALLAQHGVHGAADRGPAPYDAYTYYAQVAQQYYAANNQWLQAPAVQTSASAQAEAASPAQTQQSAAERYALYTEYLAAQQSDPNPTASSSQAGGLTQTAQPASGTGLPTTGPAEWSQLRNDPAMGSPTQSA